MNYPITGNVSLGNLSGNIKLFINDSGSSNLTGFGYNNNCMTFSVNQSVTDTPEMFINQFGNVGIGTQTPQFPLDVNGDIRLGTGTSGNIRFGTSGVGTTQSGYIDLVNNTMTVMNQQNGNIIFGTNNAEDMRISSNGNVGIGTTSPDSRLHVFISNTGTIASFVGNGVGGSNYNFDFCASIASGIPSNRIACIDDGAYSGHYGFYSKGAGGALVERMRISSNGNVGIGTQTPQFPLDVIGNIRLGTGTTGNIRFGTSGVGTTQAGYIDVINNNMTIMNHQNGNIIFGTNNGEDMRISSNGNVGIGTANPQFTLDVSGTVYINNNSAFTSYVPIYNSRPGFLLNNYNQLPSTVGSIIPFSSFNASVIGNQSYLNIYKYRYSAGNDWFSSSTRIQQMIDDTNQGYIEFNPPNASYGIGIYGGSSNSSYGTGIGITVKSNGFVGIRTTLNQQELQVNGNIILSGITNGWQQAGSRFIGLGSNNGQVGVDGFTGMEIQSVNAPSPNDGNYSQKILFWTHHNATSTGGTPRMTIQYNGYVGIGTTTPIRRLHVNHANTSNGMINEFCPAYNVDAKQILGLLAASSVIGPAPYQNYINIYWTNSEGTKYVWSGGGTALFTGQHMVVPDNSDLKTNLTEYVGLIVSSNDSGYTSYYNSIKSTGIDAINICEALPNCKLSDKDNDKAVFGVITNQKNDEYFDTDGSPLYDNIDNGFEKSLYDRIRVNSVGEGSIWVTNINGNLENGDYITSSAIHGYGKRQNDDLLHNYTVAKSTMSCEFVLNSPNYKTKSVIWEGNTYIAAFIGCSYHCG